MKNFLLTFSLLACLAGSAHTTEVFIDTVSSYSGCYTPNLVGSQTAQTIEQVIRIYNPDSVLEAFALGLSFASSDPTRPVSITSMEPLLSIPGWPPPIYFSIEEDGRSKFYMRYWQFPASPDTVEVARIEITFQGNSSTDEYQICIDSSGLNAYNPGQFIIPLTEGVTYQTQFCYDVMFVVNCGVEPAYVPSILSNQSFCEPITYSFEEIGCFYNTRWEVLSGPGDFGGGSPLYTFTPGLESAGQTFAVHFRIRDDVCRDGSFAAWNAFTSVPDSFLVSVAPNIESPSFPAQQTAFAAETGVPCYIAPIVNDVDPCQLKYSYFWHFQDPEPPCSIDSSTGVLTYLGQSEDTADHYVYIVVDEAGAKDTLNAILRHWESVLCGDMNHSGSRNLTDLTLLVNYLFVAGPPPVPLAAGDVNCSGTVNLTDVTQFVNFLFLNAADPCLNCP